MEAAAAARGTEAIVASPVPATAISSVWITRDASSPIGPKVGGVIRCSSRQVSCQPASTEDSETSIHQHPNTAVAR